MRSQLQHWLAPPVFADDERTRRADQALYLAKAQGRNRVVVWGADNQ